MNCWFCNTNTRVPYNQQNSFKCPSCSQFNGFTDDGDYNREIPEQHYSKLNASNSSFCQKTELRLPATNGLCEGCNRNQEMKVIQLANFRPRCEINYDEEIEEYKQKLEDSYQLCQQCQRHLKKTLNRVKTKLIGSKISQIVTNVVKSTKNAVKDRQIIMKLTMISVFLLSVVNLLKEMNVSLDFALANESLKLVYFHIVALRLTIIELLSHWTKDLALESMQIDAIATTAVFLNLSMLFKNKKTRYPVIASMLFWSLKMMLTEFPINPSYVLAVKGSIATILVVTSLATIFKSRGDKKPTVDQNGSFHKIHTEVSEESDNELEISDDNRSIRSSIYPSLCSSIRERTLVESAKSFAVNRTMLNSTFGRQDATNTNDLLSNRSFSIRQEVSLADRYQVQSDITKLNISGSLLGSNSTLKDFSLNKSLNPFSLQNSRCGSPTPSVTSVFSGAYHTQMISPPRLESTYLAEANKSWVAGGYWSSPQKRYLEVSYLKQHPEMSRSSSQSSGLGTIESEKNSRENSIGNDDVTSIFSEPVRRRNLFEKPSDARSLFGQSFSQPPKVNNFFLNSNANNFRKYRETNSFFK